jgi:predicted alpha/beta hydrolase
MNEELRIISTPLGNQIYSKKFIGNSTSQDVVLIAPAMGIQQKFYSEYARYISNQGYEVWTFDYDGIGESKRRSLATYSCNLLDWIEDSFESVLNQAISENSSSKIFIVGHSFGGQCTPLLPSSKKISGLVNIAVGSGFYDH